MVIRYNVGDVELPFDVKFLYPCILQKLFSNLVLDLPYCFKISYPIKVLGHKYDCFLKSNKNQIYKSSCQHDL